MRTPRPAVVVFLVLVGSYAFFWHSRDWNSSSRIMLTYALVDRGTVVINGLEDHTRDRARVGGRYYSDKQPGYSLLATVPYVLGRRILGLPNHPLMRKGDGFTHWISDYWIALGTSGLLSAACGTILTTLARGFGCGPRRAMLVGLAYGLGTPAYVYATLNYGHQATAFFLLVAYAAMETAAGSARARNLSLAAGFSSAMASVIELQAGPISALLTGYFLVLIVTKRLPLSSLATFAAGAAVPTAGLLAYNVAAFGSPFDMGYFHEDLAQFREVHSAGNPLGLGRVAWSRLGDLLWGEHRGLVAFAPIVLLAPGGYLVLAKRRRWDVLGMSLGAVTCGLLVNLSYPEWTGGWSTGPRLLVPILPFLMIPVAALLGLNRRPITIATVLLALLGGAEMTVFQAVGARIPPAPEAAVARDTPFHHPLRGVAWPLFRGDPIPPWWIGKRFDRTLLDARWGPSLDALPVGWRWVRFAPLILAQCLMIARGLATLRPRAISDPPPR